MSQNLSKDQFSPYDERPLTVPLIFVAIALILKGIVCIVFANWFHSIGYPVGETVLEPIVQIVIGFTLLPNLVFARFLNLFYCGASFLGGSSFFFRAGMKNVYFRNVSILSFFCYGLCTMILIGHLFMQWKKSGESAKSFLLWGIFPVSLNFENMDYYGPVFNKIKNNISILSWNWAAFLFSFFWQIYRGLWLKGLLYAAFFFLLKSWIEFLNYPLLHYIVWTGVPLFYGAISNYDYYLLKIHGEPLWLRLPYRRCKRVAWGVMGTLLILIALSFMGDSRSNSVRGSYYSSIQSLGKRDFQIRLRRGVTFEISLPEAWNISRLRSKGPWIVITLPGFDKLGFGIYDLPEKFQEEPENASLSTFVRQRIVEKSWISRLIYNSSDWTCSEQDAQKGQPWRFCGYRGARAISFQVVYSVLGKQLVVVTHSSRTSATEAVFQEELKLFLSSIRRDTELAKPAGAN